MTFEDVLTNIAEKFGLDSYDLIGYSYEDEISGWDGGYGEWPIGSIWTVEGRILYALIRALKPQRIIEIGTNVGCGASHIAAALKENGDGVLLSFDNAKSIVIPPDKTGYTAVYEQGGLIPDDLREYVELVNADALEYLREYVGEVDFIFEDGDHSVDSTREAWAMGVPKLSLGGVMISHDAGHFLVGEAIRQGIQEAGYTPMIYEVQPSDCGLAVYRKPTEKRKNDDLTVEAGDAELFTPKTDEPIPLSAFIPTTATELEPAFDDMTLKQLKGYAETHDIALGSARTKAKIIDKLRSAF
jgi:predicted O-methyltransferase YrrM